MNKLIKILISKFSLFDKLYKLIRASNQRMLLRKWKKGLPMTGPPHFIKQQIIKKYAVDFNLDTLVETGTYLGDMVYAVKDDFREIFSVEFDDALFKRAKRLFANYPHIHIVNGDSSKVLPKILNSLSKPCLFWLDAHYSQGLTSKADEETPIKEEIKYILETSENRHVVLIDDAHLFMGQNAYPALGKLRTFVLKEHPDWVFEVKDDIIRLHRKRN